MKWKPQLLKIHNLFDQISYVRLNADHETGSVSALLTLLGVSNDSWISAWWIFAKLSNSIFAMNCFLIRPFKNIRVIYQTISLLKLQMRNRILVQITRVLSLFYFKNRVQRHWPKSPEKAWHFRLTKYICWNQPFS